MAHERRILRLQSRIKRDVAELIQRDLKDPRMKGLLTITRVKVARDLGHARVYYTVLGSAGQRRAAAQFIESARPYVQRAVVQGLKIRIAPKIEFTYDQSIEKQAGVSKLIEEALAADARPKSATEAGLRPKRRRKHTDEEE